MFNIQKMMQQAKQVQEKLEEVQEKLKDIDVTGEAGNGLVKITMSCAYEIRNVSIDPSLLAPANKEMLEDLIAAALNNANEAKETRVKQETQSMTQSLGIDANTKFPF